MKNRNIKFLGIVFVGLVVCGTLSSTFLSADSSSSLNIKIKKLDSEELKNSLKLKDSVPNEITQVLEQQVNKLKIYQEAQENPIKEVCIDSSSYTFSDLKPGYKYKVETYYDVVKVGESEWILLSSGDQKQIEITPEPQFVITSALVVYVAGVAILHAGISAVSYLVINRGNWDCEGLLSSTTIGAAIGAASALIPIFSSSTIINVLGTDPNIGTMAGMALSDLIRPVIESTHICDIYRNSLSTAIDIINEQKGYMESQLQDTVEKLVAEESNVNVPSDSGWWIDFSTQSIETSSEMQVSTYAMGYNSNYDGTWVMSNPGSSSLTASFSISELASGTILRITHLGEGNCPVDIEVNGNKLVDNYDPTSYSRFVEDSWQISQYLHLGTNTVEISLQSSAAGTARYWIKQLSVGIGKDNLAKVKASTNKDVYGAGEIVYLKAEVTNSVGTYIPASSVTYQVEGTSISGSLIGSDGIYSYGFTSPTTPNTYNITVSATTNYGTVSGEKTITVAKGGISTDVSSITRTAFRNGVINQPIVITNVGSTDLFNVSVSKGGGISSWINISSTESDWNSSSSSFSLIPATGDDDRGINITINIPSNASYDTYTGYISIESEDGSKIEIPVEIEVVEYGAGVRTGRKYISDNSSGWDVWREFDNDRIKTGESGWYTIYPGTITLTDDWTDKEYAGSFDIDDLGMSDFDAWGKTEIRFNTGGYDSSDGNILFWFNSDEKYWSTWYGYVIPHTISLCGGRPPLPKKKENNILKLSYSPVSGPHPSKIYISNIQIRALYYKYNKRDWEDDFSLSSSRLNNILSGYLEFDVYGADSSNDFPVYVYLNGEEVGTLTADFMEWNENQKIDIDTSLLKRENTVKLITHTDSVYEIDGGRFCYTYYVPVDIDVEFNANELQTTVGETFTLTGTILNDGGETAYNTEVNLNFDSNKFQLLSGNSHYNIGSLSSGDSRTYTWELKALQGGTYSITMEGSASGSGGDLNESESCTISAVSYGVDLTASIYSKTIEEDQDTVTFDLTVKNTGTTQDTITLLLDKSKLPGGWDASLNKYSVALLSNNTEIISLQMNIDTLWQQKTGSVIVTAISGGDDSKRCSKEFTVNVNENDSPETATEVSHGVINDLYCNGKDWYKFYLKKGYALDIYIEFTHSEGNLDLELYNSNMQLIHGSYSVNDSERVYTFNDSEDTYYYIKIYGYNGATNSYDMYVGEILDRGSMSINSSHQYAAHAAIPLNSDNTSLSVPNMIQGCGWRSFAIVTNVGTTTASGTIHYYDSDGDGSEITSEAFTLEPHAWEVVKWNDIVTNYGIDRGSVVINSSQPITAYVGLGNYTSVRCSCSYSAEQ